MKKIMMLALLLSAGTLAAQEINPTFEQQGETVKGTFYHDNGTVKQEGTYKNGKLDGKWVMYDEDGKKIAMGEYNQGEKTGKWFFWKKEELTEVDYNDNRVAEVTTWNNSSTIVSNK